MVRNDRLKKTGESTKLIAEFVEDVGEQRV